MINALYWLADKIAKLAYALELKQKDNPPPGGYFKTGEWNDPEPRRNFSVNPYGTEYANGGDKPDEEWAVL